MWKKDAPGLEKDLDNLGDLLLVVGGAALGKYAVKSFLRWYEKHNAQNENSTYYFGSGDADLGFMPVKSQYRRR